MKKILAFCSLTLFFVCVFITPVYAVTSLETFREQATVEEQTAVIGTNVVLHQVIHGPGTTTYRYKLSTDCPHWSYEDRYVSETPLSFDLDHAAVETEAVELTVKWDGTVLATGQHFSVPLLGLESEDISYETFKDRMLETAYAQLEGESSSFGAGNVLIILAGMTVVALIVYLVWPQKRSDGKSKRKGKRYLLPLDDEPNVYLTVEGAWWEEALFIETVENWKKVHRLTRETAKSLIDVLMGQGLDIEVANYTVNKDIVFENKL